jgi:hypothetical protein
MLRGTAGTLTCSFPFWRGLERGAGVTRAGRMSRTILLQGCDRAASTAGHPTFRETAFTTAGFGFAEQLGIGQATPRTPALSGAGALWNSRREASTTAQHVDAIQVGPRRRPRLWRRPGLPGRPDGHSAPARDRPSHWSSPFKFAHLAPDGVAFPSEHLEA